MFFYLARNPDKYQRLVDEIRGQFASREAICLGSKLSSCRFLQACISESLRLAPPVAAVPFREVKKGGIVVDNHFVPEGTNVGVGIFSIQHSEQYFHDAYEFLPERWLGERKESEAFDTDAHVPFGIGPRICLGKALVTAELSLIMAHMISTMDFAVVESMRDVGAGKKGAVYGRHRPGEYQLYDHITSARDGPMVQFRNRV